MFFLHRAEFTSKNELLALNVLHAVSGEFRSGAKAQQSTFVTYVRLSAYINPTKIYGRRLWMVAMKKCCYLLLVQGYFGGYWNRIGWSFGLVLTLLLVLVVDGCQQAICEH